MQTPQEARPRAKSPFTAAFLSLVFPGLGQLYAGAPMRALGFAAVPILLIALGSGVLLRMDRLELLGLVLNPFTLTSVFVVNIIALLYRLVAIIDAYRCAEYVNAHAASGDGRLGRARMPRNMLSLAGLLAVLLVMAGSHVVVARYDMLAMELTGDCIFVSDTTEDDCESDDPSAAPDASEPAGSPEETADSTSAPPSEAATPEATPIGTPVPAVSIAPWDGKKRLNILLIGADEQGGGINTDTLITVSIDPVTKQVAMFSLPRDTKNVPVPSGPARSVWGRVYQNKINSFYMNNRNRSDLWPGGKSTRGYNALKELLGELYGLDIKYFVKVNFEGFRNVVDAMGGVTINVQIPIVDDSFPAGANRSRRLYIPSGIQHMTGAQALRYARSRNTSNDFDRAARQQRVLLSLREQADPQAIIPRIPELVQALKKTVKTDIPIDQIDELLGLASEVDTSNIRSYVFAPPTYQREVLSGYWTLPYVDKIRSTVKNAFKANPADEARRERLAQEGATVWVLNGTSDATRGADLAGYLEYQGLAASSPRQKPKGKVPADTKIVVYNGAEEEMAETIAYLEKRFKVKATPATDPAVAADVVITIGRETPKFTAPPLN
jgi:LCP family protein required for cell wall assembly